MARKRKGGPRPARRAPELLAIPARDRLKQRINEGKGYQSGVGTADDGDVSLAHRDARPSIDEGQINRRISRDERALERLDPSNHKLSGAERQQGYTRMKVLEEYITKCMLSENEMGAFPAASDHTKDRKYHQAVEKSMKMEVGNPRFVEAAHEYKRLARRLDPDNPELCNLERFRRAGG